MYARVITWWVILRISIEERMVYRGDFMLGTLMRFLPIITQIFLWYAIFESLGNDNIASYTSDDVIAYYLLTMLSRAFSSMPGLASGLALQIRDGEIKKFMIQPVDLVSFLLLTRVAHKLTYYVIATLPFALVFFLCSGFFTRGWPDPAPFAAFLASLVMAFLLGFFIEICIGLIGFWFLEVSSLLFIYMLMSFFLSGHMFPLDFLSWPFDIIVDLLPLKYLAYFPAAIFLKKVEGWELVRGLAIEACWLVFFIFLSRVMLHFGVKRYSGYGG